MEQIKVLKEPLVFNFDNKNFSDVIFLLNNLIIYLHKIILATSSPIFEQLFIMNPKEPQFRIELSGSKPSTLLSLFELIYTGQSIVKNKNEEKALKKLGEQLQIKGFCTETKKKKPQQTIPKKKNYCSKSVQNKNQKRRYQCEACYRSFCNPSNLRRHFRFKHQ